MTTYTAAREAFERLYAVGFDLAWSDRLDGYVSNNTQYSYQMFRDGYVACTAHLAQQPVATVDDRNYAMNSEPERKRFEEYIRERQPGASFVFHRRPNGPYIDDFTEYQWLAWDYRASLKPQPDTSRDDRQRTVSDWCRNAFGDDQASGLPQRGIRLLEEAIEAAQAAGCERDMSHKLVDFIFDRPAGELKQELGGIGVTVLALAAAANLSADVCETREIERVLSKPLTYFTQRNQAKNDAGFEASEKDK